MWFQSLPGLPGCRTPATLKIGSIYRRGGNGSRTRGVGQFILSALNLVLQALSLAPGGRDLGLHLFAAHVGHCVGMVLRVTTVKWEVGKSGTLRGRGSMGGGAKKEEKKSGKED